MSGRVDQSIFKWFGHMEGIDEGRPPKKKYSVKMSGAKVTGKSRPKR